MECRKWHRNESQKTEHLRVSLKNCDSLIKYNINGVVINEFNVVNH
jgi:hypothetical protein